MGLQTDILAGAPRRAQARLRLFAGAVLLSCGLLTQTRKLS